MAKQHLTMAVAATIMAANGGMAFAQGTAATTVPVDEGQDEDGDEGKWGLLGLVGLAGLLGLRRRDRHDDTTRR